MYYVRDHLLRKALNTFEASPYFLSWWRGTHTIKTLKKFLDVKHWNLESFVSYLYCLAAWRGSEALVIPLPTIRISAPLSRIALLGLTYRWSPPEPQRVRFQKLEVNQRLIKGIAHSPSSEAARWTPGVNWSWPASWQYRCDWTDYLFTFLAVQDSSITDIVGRLVCPLEPANNQSLGNIKDPRH